MEKRHALLVSFLITALFVGNFLFFHDFGTGRERVIVARAIDGDTLQLEDGRTVRLMNLNTPEKEEFYYEESKRFLESLENHSVELASAGIDKYGRTLGEIYSPEYINLEIVRRGLAHTFLIKEDEIPEFKKAENEAFESELGIWKRSNDYGCLQVEINKYDEFVSIKIECDIDITGWKIKDESTKRYSFKKDFDKEVIVHSSKGDDKENEVYWGSGNVWNNDKDSIFVRDSDGLLVYYADYGY